MAPARSATSRKPSSSIRPVDATPIRLPIATRRLRWTLVSSTFWWISLFANRVSGASSAVTRASASVAPAAIARPTARSAIASHSCLPSALTSRTSLLENSHLDVAEPCAGDRVADVAGLERLALAAVGRAQHPVARGVADRVARPPQLVGDAGVRRVLHQPAALPAADLVGDLGRALEVEPAIVDRPAAAPGPVKAVVRVGHDVVQAHARDGQEIDVGHPDERNPVPAIGSHRPAGSPPDPGRGLARCQVAAEDAVLDEGHGLRGDALVVPAEGAHAARGGGR